MITLLIWVTVAHVAGANEVTAIAAKSTQGEGMATVQFRRASADNVLQQALTKRRAVVERWVKVINPMHEETTELRDDDLPEFIDAL